MYCNVEGLVLSGQLQVCLTQRHHLRSHLLLLLHLLQHLVDRLQVLVGFVELHQLYVVFTELTLVGPI